MTITPEEVEAHVQQAMAQGFPRFIEDPETLRIIANAIGRPERKERAS